MSHVFISYNRKADGDFADLLVSRLQSEGLSTWVDNDMLNAGEDWRVTIDQAIRDAFALVVIMSPEAKASEYVTYEWAFAWGARVKVLPVLYKPVELHPRLEALQYVDFTNRSFRPWDRLIKLIKHEAEEQAYLVHTQQETLYELLTLCTVGLSNPSTSGTGFFIDSNLILTCAHVVGDIENNQTIVIVQWEDQTYRAKIERLLPSPYPDLALLKLEDALAVHPCVFLHNAVQVGDRLYSYGYTKNYPHGEPVTFEMEGMTGDPARLLTFKSGMSGVGMSGAPLLNIRTGGVCGIINRTRGSNAIMGGRGIPTKTIFQSFPELKGLQEQFHQDNRRWMNSLSPQLRQAIALSRS